MPSFPHAVIIAAAGSSVRFLKGENNSYAKKEFFLLDDRSVLYHATKPFLNIPGLQLVLICYGEGWEEETKRALGNLPADSPVPFLFVAGGATRQKSVYNALEALAAQRTSASYVLIHDGARPWITQSIIKKTLEGAALWGGAAPVVPIHDAVKRVDSEGRIVSHVNRDSLVAVQTPQAFRLSEILDAHRQAAATQKTYCDDTEIYADFGGIVKTTAGSIANRKITTLSDVHFREYVP